MDIEGDINDLVSNIYADSDPEYDLPPSKTKKIQFYQDLVQKANSIGGIRKLNYLFKQRRREVLTGNDTSSIE